MYHDSMIDRQDRSAASGLCYRTVKTRLHERDMGILRQPRVVLSFSLYYAAREYFLLATRPPARLVFIAMIVWDVLRV
jgi:hypothetical protein